ncbi:C1 family peptidase [Methanobrevibacter sp.]
MLTILFVALLAVSPISAADNASDDVVGAEDVVNDIIAADDASEDVVSVDDEKHVIMEGNVSDVGTFAELGTEINNVDEGGLLTLTRDYINVNDSDFSILINKSITIDGNGHTLDANNLSGIFDVNSEGVILKNINFINGNSQKTDSVIDIFGEVSIINCNFVNHCAGGLRAVLFSDYASSTLYIKNSTFIDNDCTDTIWFRGNLNIEDSKLINNSGDHALLSYKGNKGLVRNIKNTIFHSGNTMQKVSLYGGKFNVSNCDFRNVYFFYDDNNYFLNVINTSFKDSVVEVEATLKEKVVNSSFINCSFQNSPIVSYGANLTIFNSQLVNSSSEWLLQALFCDVVIEKSSFTNNSVENIGGALFFNGGSLSISDSVFENNCAYSGGALAIFNTDCLSLENNLFKNNCATYVGGAIYSLRDVGENNIFVNNSAEDFNDVYFLVAKDQISTLVFTDTNSTFYHIDYANITDIPSYFNLKDECYLTPIKNQLNSGACWSFAMISSIESAILKLTGNPIDLSENNMKNLMHHYSIYGTNLEPDEGGYFSTSLGYLSSWLGPVLESEDEFDEKSVFSNRLNPALHIQNAIFIGDMHHTDLSLIKKAIMTYGPLETGIWVCADEENDFKQYSDEMYIQNHAVVIVGWDDEMEIPGAPQKGAWIFRNSYGSDWGHDGYFYVSYDDATYHEPFGIENWEVYGIDGIVFEFCDNILYEKNYQYELGLSDFFINKSVSWYKNIFYSTGDEYLAAASTYFNRDCEWMMNVYVNDELNQSKAGFSTAGYHTIELDNFIPLKEGDKFEVVFKLLTDGVYIPFACSDKFTSDFSQENLSFISEDGVTWIDLSDYVWRDSYLRSHNSQMACIKAFTILNSVGTILNLSVDFDGFNSANLTANVLNQYGIPLNKGEVMFNISGNIIKANVSGGVAKISAVLSGGLNSIQAQFTAVGFNSSSNSTSINAKAKTALKASSVQTVYNVNKYLTVTLKDENGKPVDGAKVIVNLNGAKTYVTKNGQIKINVKNLVPKSYSVKISFNGDDNYIKTASAVKVVVKKAKPKIIAKKKTFKAKTKIKMYSIVLKNNINKPLKKVKVALRVKGKTYKAVTNSKGKATFKITKLTKKGKFTAAVKYAGSRYYSAKTVKQIIIVR